MSPHLDDARRAALARHLLARTLSALRQSSSVARIALATPDQFLARETGVDWLPDPGSLNEALEGAVTWALRHGAERLLLLPADLSLLDAVDVRLLIASEHDTPGIVIAPTTDGGTGALLLTPPDALRPAFGRESFRRHCRQARRQKIDIRVVALEGFAHDVDTIDDLHALLPELLLSDLPVENLNRWGETGW